MTGQLTADNPSEQELAPTSDKRRTKEDYFGHVPDISAEDAFSRFLLRGDDDIAALHRELNAEGIRCSYRWLCKIATRDDWREMASLFRHDTKYKLSAASFEALAKDGAKLTAQHYEGLEARYLSTLAVLVATLKLDDGDKMLKHFEALNVLQVVIAAKRNGMPMQSSGGEGAGSNVIGLGRFGTSPPA